MRMPIYTRNVVFIIMLCNYAEMKVCKVNLIIRVRRELRETQIAVACKFYKHS